MTPPAVAPDRATDLLPATRRLMWLLVVPVLALLALLSGMQLRQALRDAEAQLLAQARVRAQELEAAARPAMAHVHDLRRLLEARWQSPPEAGAELRAALRQHHAQGRPDGWSLDAADPVQQELFGQVWWAPPDGSAPDPAWLGRARLFVDLARVAQQRAPGFEATWFAAAEVNTSFGYPFVDTAAMLRSMGQPNLVAIDGPRRVAAERSIRALAEDPNDLTFWGRPYVSQLDGELVVSHGAMVIADGRYQGEVSVDVRLAALQRHAARWATSGFAADGSRVWLVDARLHLLGDSASPLAGPGGAGRADQPLEIGLAERLPQGIRRADLDDLLLDPGHVRRGGGWRLVAAQHIGSPWLYVQAVPDRTMLALLAPQFAANLALALALLAMFVAGQWLLARRFVGPALAVLDYLRRLAHADADRPVAAPRVPGGWQAWVDDAGETFRRQTEAARQIDEQRDALRRSEKMSAMGSLLAGVAHELNNPLAIVVGRAQLLEDRCTDAPALQADARRIREAAERCGRIVRTFLDMARSRPARHAPVALNDLVRAAAEMLGYTFRSHDIALELALDDALPTVLADGDQIGQVVLNLMVNAQQALAASPAPRRVRITSGVAPAGAPRRVWLRIADNGPGVDPAARERLFEPFFTTKPEGIGTGLGLAVSRSIAVEHGGDLRLVDGEGGGACFELALPLRQPAAPEPAVAAPAAAADAAPARILVVDDEAEIAELMRSMLESAGYQVASAGSGAAALALLEHTPVDAIVSDLRMPDIDGAALWRSVQRRDPRLARRMLFVTGDTLSADARGFLDAAGAPSLDKPFAMRDLLDRVQRLLAA